MLAFFIGHAFGQMQGVAFFLFLQLAKGNKRWPFSSVMPLAGCKALPFFFSSSSPKAISAGLFHRSCLWPAAKRWFSSSPSDSPKAISVGLVSAERSFFAAFAFGLCGFLFHPCYIFSPGQGLFCFRLRRISLPPFGKILRRSTVLPWSRISICINTKTPDLALQRPKIGCFFFPKSCGGKSTQTLSAFIRSRRCPGRSPRR